MDEVDAAILRELRHDARTTNAEIGERVGLTEGAVRHRILRLREDGVLLRSTVITRPMGPEGLVLVRCRPGATEAVVARLRAMSDDLFETSGEYDLAAIVERRTMEEFNAALDAIRGFPGVERTATLVRLTRFVGEAAEGRRVRPAGASEPSAPRSGRAGARSRGRARSAGA